MTTSEFTRNEDMPKHSPASSSRSGAIAPMLSLEEIVHAFARGLILADARQPQARSARSHRVYQPGIGPFAEPKVVELVMKELAAESPERLGSYVLGTPYPVNQRRKCDLLLEGDTDWAIEIKMARFRGDNGKPADEMLMHLISPYEEDRSALTDCLKLATSGFQSHLAVLIYGFDHPDKSLDPAIDAFELLARARVKLGPRYTAPLEGLIHPVFHQGRVFGWEIFPA